MISYDDLIDRAYAHARDLARIPARVRVFIALLEVPNDAPVVALRAHAGVNEAELREAMRDLALRDHEPEA